MAPTTRRAAKVLTAVLEESLGNVDQSNFVRRGERFRRAPSMFINSVTNNALVGTATATARQSASNVATVASATNIAVPPNPPARGAGLGRRRSAPAPGTRAIRNVVAPSRATRARRASATPRITKRKSDEVQEKEPTKRLRSAQNAVLETPMTTVSEVGLEMEVVEEELGPAAESAEKEDPKDGDFEPATPLTTAPEVGLDVEIADKVLDPIEEYTEREDPQDGDFEPETSSLLLPAPALALQIAKKPRIARTPRGKKIDDPTPVVGIADQASVSGPPAVSPVTARRPATTRRSGPLVPPGVVARPKPDGTPLVWAEGRQALCETLPYYRAYQSGAYTSDGLAYGFLLAQHGDKSAFMDEYVVITSAGGHCEKDEDGKIIQTTSHSGDSTQIRSVRNNLRYHVPVILIVGKENRDCPTEPPHEYCVMGTFQVTDVWPELTNGLKCYKYRFEKIDLTSKSWWAVTGSRSPPASPDFLTRAIRRVCGICNHESAQIYVPNWLCLNERCANYWTDNGTKPTAVLTWNPAFIQERTQWPEHIKPPFSEKPEPMKLNVEDGASAVYARSQWKGIVCDNCGRCISRNHWDSWRCETDDCGFVRKVVQPILSARSLLDPNEPEIVGHALPMDKFQPPVSIRRPEYDGNWRIHTYDLAPGNCVMHFHANTPLNEAKGGADELFRDLQLDNSMGLQRFPMKMKTAKGKFLATHFSMNFGLEYDYVVATESRSFGDAPPAVLRALNRMTWAAKKTVVDGSFEKFNELLAVGYFEACKMGYHDDGEKTLGPTIATLSLGCPAVMTLKMKERYYKGTTKGDRYDPKEPVLPGSALEQERKALNTLHTILTENEFEERRKKMYKDNAKKIGSPPVILTMALAHGDIIIMHGAEMQKYFAHMIKPSGDVRFGLTCRYVKPEMVRPEYHHMGEYDEEAVAKYYGDGDVSEANAKDSDMSGLPPTGNDVSPMAENAA